MSARPGTREIAAAVQTLALLNEQADVLRTELVRVRKALADARRDFDGTRAAELLAANEHLVLAALHAENDAETAVSDMATLARAVQRDSLTDTPNRSLMLDRLTSAIALGRRRGTRIAVLFVDLDHFKPINDTLGHAAGDEALQLVARRLESVVRDSDTVSRHGGDEFLILLTEVTAPSDAAVIAAKLLSALAAPIHLGEHVLQLSASLGISIYPEDGLDAQTLISGADAAMYRSKRLGRGRFEFYSPDSATDATTPVPGNAADVSTVGDELSDQHASSLRDLREANEQLVMVALQAQGLEIAAAEAHRRQINFLATAAHELRNPLAPIRTAADLLDRARTDAPLLARLQEMIKRQVAEMSRLVDDLLDGSRVSTGTFRLERQTVDLVEILERAVEAARPAINNRLQHLTIELPTSPVRLNADPMRLAQILNNLLDNATKYTPAHGAIRIAAVTGAGAVAITISDTGIGITAEALPNIFDLFVQDPRAVAFHNGGLGIGLAVVRDLVEAHGGTVLARSEGSDLGSEFVVTLPVAEDLTATSVT